MHDINYSRLGNFKLLKPWTLKYHPAKDTLSKNMNSDLYAYIQYIYVKTHIHRHKYTHTCIYTPAFGGLGTARFLLHFLYSYFYSLRRHSFDKK